MTGTRGGSKRAFPTLRDVALFAEALITLGIASAAIGLLSFRSVARMMGRREVRPEALKHDPGRAAEIAQAVTRASRRAPWRSVCFHEGLAAHWMLRRRGYPSRLHYGLSKVQNLSAHVWVTTDGQTIVGGDREPEFHCVAIFPSDEQGRP